MAHYESIYQFYHGDEHQFAMLDYQRIPEASCSMNGGGRQLMAVGDLRNEDGPWFALARQLCTFGAFGFRPGFIQQSYGICGGIKGTKEQPLYSILV